MFSIVDEFTRTYIGKLFSFCGRVSDLSKNTGCSRAEGNVQCLATDPLTP